MTGKIKLRQSVAIKHALNVTLKLQEKLGMKSREGKTLQGTLEIERELNKGLLEISQRKNNNLYSNK